ncbi:galectin-9-like isoform X2 [Cimex lectularius]|uniref:Galectin n=1 Tax=Cimex lectularius TaxID=79782 RepID=A0A8I6SKA1_CIMLE|nr:galectin-9-like isoform X2 [Cimex lectularius]
MCVADLQTVYDVRTGSHLEEWPRQKYYIFRLYINVPYVGPINHEFTPGVEVEINAFIYPYARRFAINLQCGPNLSPCDDIALHFSPDFDRMIVVRNSVVSNNWGPEETVGPFPFIKGQNCRICFRHDIDSFKIKVDENEFISFIHRISPTRITHVVINGEINLSSFEVRVTTAAPKYPSSPGMPSAPYPVDCGGIGFQTNRSSPIPPYPPHHAPTPPYPVGGQPPFPTPGQYQNGMNAYPMVPPNSYPSPVPPVVPPYQSGRTSPYPVQPGMPQGGYQQNPTPYYQHSPNLSYPSGGGAVPYPQQPGMPPGGAVYYPSSPGHPKQQSSGPLGKATGILGTMATGGVVGGLMKHGAKKISKKKALKYGLPIAGVGLGAYALNKTFRRGSSSSSSSGSWSD